MKPLILSVALWLTALPVLAQTSTTLVPSGATWRYLVATSAPAAAWKSDLAFTDANPPWYSGTSPLGYGGQGPSSGLVTSEGGTCVNQCVSGTTTTPSCLTCPTKEITTYFRHTVAVTGAASSTFTLRYQRDDGIVIYINGMERVRENLPAAPATITHSTTATAFPSDPDEIAWVTVAVQPGWFQEGTNLIAAEVHQLSTGSSDIRFNLDLSQLSPSTPLSSSFTSGATWRYLVTNTDPATSWKNDLNFNDTNAPWYGGTSPLGYGGQGPGSILVTSEGGTCVNQCMSGTVTAPSCLTCASRSITTYFRKKVNLTGVSSSSMTLRYQRDDGIVIYINGVERVRENLPTAPTTITYSTTATAFPSDPDEIAWVTVAVQPGWLQEGTNLIAAEVHQLSAGSSDIRFNMELLQQGVSITRGPYLQQGGQNEVTIRWRTDAPTVGRVTYGLSVSSLTGFVVETADTTDHEVRITGLLEDRQYFYSVGTTTAVLEQGPNNYFLTAPSANTKRKIRIASFGDCGNNDVADNQTKVRDGFLAYRGSTPTDLWMLIGDNSYDGADWQYQYRFFEPYQDNLLKNSMLYAVPGNHDYNGNNTLARKSRGKGIYPSFAYFDVFTLPTTFNPAEGKPTEEWYSFDYGPIHFVMLDGWGTQLVNGVEKTFHADSAAFPNHPQVVWLKQDLAATTKKWKIVYCHFPPYTQGSHTSETESELVEVRRFITPVLERYGVDVVLTGHSHGYERSYPIHGQTGPMADFAADSTAFLFPGDGTTGRYDGTFNSCAYKNTSEKKPQGTVYVVSGSAGALESSSRPKHTVMVSQTAIRSKGGSFYMEVEDNRLDAKFLQVNDSSPYTTTVTDQFTIMKDVDVVQTLTVTAGQPVTLAASFISDYVWSNPTNATFAASTRSVVVSPTVSQTFVVRDSKQCVTDVYSLVINCAGPLYSLKNGNWNDPTVWSCNRIPVGTDHVQVKHQITVPANVQAHAQKVEFDLNRKLIYGANARLLLSQ